MRDLIFFSLLSSREKKKLRRNMPRELKKLDSRKPRIKRELWPRFRGRELRYLEKCTKPVKM